MPDQLPRRRRFQFRLRTLLIAVTLLCVVFGGYVVRHLKKVEERKALLRLVVSNGGGYSTFTFFTDDEWLPGEYHLPSNSPPGTFPGHMPIGASRLHSLRPDKTPPLIRRWLGDVNVFEIWLPESFSHSDALRVVERFPEAMVSQDRK
jgi:hypothetical protein